MQFTVINSLKTGHLTRAIILFQSFFRITNLSCRGPQLESFLAATDITAEITTTCRTANGCTVL